MQLWQVLIIQFIACAVFQFVIWKWRQRKAIREFRKSVEGSNIKFIGFDKKWYAKYDYNMSPPTGGSSVVKPEPVTVNVVIKDPMNADDFAEALTRQHKKPPTWWRG